MFLSHHEKSNKETYQRLFDDMFSKLKLSLHLDPDPYSEFGFVSGSSNSVHTRSSTDSDRITYGTLFNDLFGCTFLNVCFWIAS
jgi:hypothetical protein